MPHDELTFGLALAGYALLAGDAAARVLGRRWRALTVATAVVVAAHVACVWGLRFDWSLDRMLAKGWAGFLLFHSALAAVLAAVVLGEPWRTRLVMLAFAVVSAGALAAPFRYPELHWTAVPLFGIAFGAVAVVVVGRRLRR